MFPPVPKFIFFLFWKPITHNLGLITLALKSISVPLFLFFLSPVSFLVSLPSYFFFFPSNSPCSFFFLLLPSCSSSSALDHKYCCIGWLHHKLSPIFKGERERERREINSPRSEIKLGAPHQIVSLDQIKLRFRQSMLPHCHQSTAAAPTSQHLEQLIASGIRSSSPVLLSFSLNSLFFFCSSLCANRRRYSMKKTTRRKTQKTLNPDPGPYSPNFD